MSDSSSTSKSPPPSASNKISPALMLLAVAVVAAATVILTHALDSQRSSAVGAQPPSPDVSAFVVDCSRTAMVIDGTHPGERHVATIKLINNMDSARTFHLVVDGKATADTNLGPAPEMTLQPHAETTTTYMLLSGATVGECQALDVQAVSG